MKIELSNEERDLLYKSLLDYSLTKALNIVSVNKLLRKLSIE